MRTRSTRDLMLGFAIAAELSVEYLTDGSLSTADHVVGCAVAVGIGTLVAIRHRVPLGLLAATALLIAIRTYVPPGGDGTAWGIVSLIAIYTVASECDGWEARIGFALTVALAGGILIHDGDATSVGNILFFALLGGTPWVFGRAIRHRREREQLLEERALILERDREHEARLAVEEERTRIARELHDIVGHALGVIVLQAEGWATPARRGPARDRAGASHDREHRARRTDVNAPHGRDASGERGATGAPAAAVQVAFKPAH